MHKYDSLYTHQLNKKVHILVKVVSYKKLAKFDGHQPFSNSKRSLTNFKFPIEAPQKSSENFILFKFANKKGMIFDDDVQRSPEYILHHCIWWHTVIWYFLQLI